MKLRSIVLFLLLNTFCIAAFAQKAKLGTAYAQITASAKVTETHQGEDPVIYYTMNTTWKASAAPESIFFKAAEAWANCIVLKNGKDISPEIIKKGNKVVFKTVSGGRFAVPKEIEGVATPALFFQVKGVWYYLPVKNMKKKTVKVS